MADINFRFEVEADPGRVLEAVKTPEGIRGFWTSEARVPADVGDTLELRFPVAPEPFDLRLEQSDEAAVVWRTQTFPPHWVGTTIEWNVAAGGPGATVTFRHAGFQDDGAAGSAAYTWGQIMVHLKRYAETGTPDPVFS